jgi:cobalt/nickel transport system permease protein
MENGFEWSAVMPDYSFGGLPDAVAYILSAVVGIACLVIIFKLLSLAAKPSVPAAAAA